MGELFHRVLFSNLQDVLMVVIKVKCKQHIVAPCLLYKGDGTNMASRIGVAKASSTHDFNCLSMERVTNQIRTAGWPLIS